MFLWAKVWLTLAGRGPFRRIATRIASIGAPPYKARQQYRRLNRHGYIHPSASIHCRNLELGRHIFLGARVVIHQGGDTDRVSLGDDVCIHQDSIIETGEGGSVAVGNGTALQPRAQLSAYRGSIEIGADVQIAPNCAFYPYDHGMLAGEPLRRQPLTTRGGIVVEDDAWLGFGVIVLDGVRIGSGTVIGAGSVVTRDIPAGVIACGVPARVIGTRKARDAAVGQS